MDIPVYLFTGFLDAGKTKFIQETLEDPRFNTGEPTLLVMCEEGEEEYNPDTFASDKVYILPIEDKSELNEKNLAAALKKNRCTRVLVEYNGMWLLNDLFSALPKGWLIAQEFFFADANTILTYNANMRNLVGDKLRSCELVVFNRFQPGTDIMPYHKLVRGMSRSADIAYEAPDGQVQYDDIVDPLPFDINANPCVIKDQDYALWYRDLSEEMDNYNGKTVSVKGVAVVRRGMGSDEIIFGRDVMSCCVEDLQFAGLVLRMPARKKPRNRSWINLTAKIEIRQHPVYGRVGPVLTCISWSDAIAPEDPVATFY